MALSGFQTGQIYALALLLLKLSSNVSCVNAIFFGLWLLPLAQLVIKSGFIPRILGVLAHRSWLLLPSGQPQLHPLAPFANVISGIVTVGYLAELAIVSWLAIQAAKVQFGRRRSS